jgi:capsular polysaccharide biosynthesis protein
MPVYVDLVMRVLAERRLWIALAGTAIAFAVAAILSGTVDRSWRAEIAIVVGTGSGPLRPGEGGATRELADRLDDLVRSDQIAANVVSTLRLDESRQSVLNRISVSVPQPGLLRVRVSDRDRLRAPQIAQEIGFLFTQLVEHRFPRLKAVVWDPAHLVGRSDPHWGRNLGIAAGISGVLWLPVLLPLLAMLAARPRREPAPARARVEARSAPVEAAPVESVAPVPPPEAAPPVLVAPPTPEPEPEPEPEPAPPPSVPEPTVVVEPQPPAAEPTVVVEPQPTVTQPEPAVPAAVGDWSVADLERVVRERAADFPERTEEWEIYLETMREYATPDGQLPASLDWLVWDTFGDVLEERVRK